MKSRVPENKSRTAINKMKKLFDIILSLGSIGCMIFIAINWEVNGGYGWTAYIGYHWLLSICLAIVWIVLFFRNRTSRGILTYLSITLMVGSIVLDCIWLDKTGW